MAGNPLALVAGTAVTSVRLGISTAVGQKAPAWRHGLSLAWRKGGMRTRRCIAPKGLAVLVAGNRDSLFENPPTFKADSKFGPNGPNSGPTQKLEPSQVERMLFVELLEVLRCAE